MEKKTLGILGGVGPLATMFIGELIVRRVDAQNDQEHISSIITNNPAIPDRTAYILNRSPENPVPVMLSDVQRLIAAGAELIIIPCNTAHCFYEELQKGSSVPILHMVRETVRQAALEGTGRAGILATTGTILSAVYQQACNEFGIQAVLPNEVTQKKIMSLIYDDIKSGKPIDVDKWTEIDEYMKSNGCDRVILGCTELSIIKKELYLGDYYLDSLRVLADKAIQDCGYQLAEEKQTTSLRE